MSHLELEITAELIRDLLREQHPDLADRPVRLGARGWDNQLWRLGDDLAVRLPWVTGNSDGSVRKEHAWVHAATLRPARGWAVWRALGCIFIADDAGPGGKP
jgi:hypothetical protein